MASSTSDVVESEDSRLSEDSREGPSNSVVTLLDRLKSPSAADIARCRKLKTNKPPLGKRKCRGGLSSDPKGVSPTQRVKEFAEENLTVSAGQLFCLACREELSLKRSIINNHVLSAKHQNSKKRLKTKEAKEQTIVESLRKYNTAIHPRGETLPESQQVYRIKVVQAFLRARVPLNKMDAFRDILEENAYRLTDRRNMYDYIPFILKEEETRIRKDIDGRCLSVILDGTSRMGEALAIILRYVGDDWDLQQRLVRVQMLSKSLTGEEIARELINILSGMYGIRSNSLLGAMRDRASTNNVAMQTLKVVYPSIVDIGCFSHTIDHVGDKFNTPVLKEFTTAWITLFSHSPKTKLLWKSQTERSMSSYSSTRWWSKWELMKQIMTYFGDIRLFLEANTDIGPATRPKLMSILDDPQKCALLQIELAATVDYGEPFVKACYFLEGDGPLALDCYETVERVKSAVHVAHVPNVRAIAQKVSGKPTGDPLCVQWMTYAKSCVQPGLEYFQRQTMTSLKNSIEVFKAARLFSPQKVVSIQPDATAVNALLTCVPFLNGKEELDALKSELPTYLSRATDTSPDFDPLNWWKSNSHALPRWSAAAAKMLLLQPSSAAAERAFSLLKASFGEQQDNALQDYIEASLMMQFNKH